MGGKAHGYLQGLLASPGPASQYRMKQFIGLMRLKVKLMH